MDIVHVKQLSKTYGRDAAQVNALNDVSFDVEKGSFVAIMGASGSGKSTLIHMIGGVDRPSFGSVRIDGHDIFDMTESEMAVFRRRNLGIVYQFYNLIPTLTTDENIMLPYLLDGRRPDNAKLKELLEITRLTDRVSHLPNQLSGGQQQRVSIARALINSPAVVLADEPTGNLDSKLGQEIMELFVLANKQLNQTIIMVTHDENAAQYADRLITMNDGKIVNDKRLTQ